MPWVRIDEEFYDNPKWVGAPGDSIALWVAMIAWCNRNDSTEGFIPAIKTQGLVNVRNLKATLADLCSRGAPHPVVRQVEGGYVIHDYTEYQQPEKVREIAAKRAAAGKKGATRRWGKSPPDPQANGMANAIANATDVAMTNGCPDPVPDPVTNSRTATSSHHPHGVLDGQTIEQAIDKVADAIILWRARDQQIKNRQKYLDAARPGVIAEHGERILDLIDHFPHAPLDLIVQTIEGGDARNLALFAADPKPASEATVTPIDRARRLELLTTNGAASRLVQPRTANVDLPGDHA